MSEGSMTWSPFASNCFGTYVYPFVSVAEALLGFVTVTLTAPPACAGVVAVIFVELTTTTLVAAAPPKVTVAPLTKPVPLIVTDLPPVVRPAGGTTEVMLRPGDVAVTLTLADFASVQPLASVTVTLSVSVPTAPAVKVMLFVPVPPVIVPLVIDQLYDAPAPAFATEATLPVVPVCAEPGAVIVAFGFGLTETVVTAEGALEQLLPLVTTTV